MRIRLCFFVRFSGLAILLNMVEDTAVLPQGVLDAYIALIPKVDGGLHALRPMAFMCSAGCL